MNRDMRYAHYCTLTGRDRRAIFPDIADLITAAAFPEEMKLIRSGRCPICGESPLRDKVGELVFRDELSREEYNISRICEPCQDAAMENRLEIRCIQQRGGE